MASAWRVASLAMPSATAATWQAALDEGRARDREPVADAAEDVLGRDQRVDELDLGREVRGTGHALLDASDREPRQRSGLDEEARHPARAPAGAVRVGDDGHQRGLVAVGDEVLGAVEAEAVAVRGGGGADPRDIGARVRLRQGERGDDLAGGDARQPTLLLGLGAVDGQRPRADAVRVPGRGEERHRHPAEFLEHQAGGIRAETEAAVGLRDRQRVVAVVAQRFRHRGRDLAGLAVEALEREQVVDEVPRGALELVQVGQLLGRRRPHQSLDHDDVGHRRRRALQRREEELAEVLRRHEARLAVLVVPDAVADGGHALVDADQLGGRAVGLQRPDEPIEDCCHHGGVSHHASSIATVTGPPMPHMTVLRPAAPPTTARS